MIGSGVVVPERTVVRHRAIFTDVPAQTPRDIPGTGTDEGVSVGALREHTAKDAYGRCITSSRTPSTG